MTFVNDDAIVFVYLRWTAVLGIVKDSLDEALDRCNVHECVCIGFLFVDLLDAKDVGKRLEAFHTRVFERICGLFTQSRAID